MRLETFIAEVVKTLKTQLPAGTRVSFELKVFVWQARGTNDLDIYIFNGHMPADMPTHQISFELTV